VFVYPRDNGANALQKIFREGSPSRAGRSANHAITELRTLHRTDAPQRQDLSVNIASISGHNGATAPICKGAALCRGTKAPGPPAILRVDCLRSTREPTRSMPPTVGDCTRQTGVAGRDSGGRATGATNLMREQVSFLADLLGDRALLCLDRQTSPPCQGFRSDRHPGRGIPLRPIRHGSHRSRYILKVRSIRSAEQIRPCIDTRRPHVVVGVLIAMRSTLTASKVRVAVQFLVVGQTCLRFAGPCSEAFPRAAVVCPAHRDRGIVGDWQPLATTRGDSRKHRT